jgi:hypothetical protein
MSLCCAASCGAAVAVGGNSRYNCSVTTTANNPLSTAGTLNYTVTARAVTAGSWSTTIVISPPVDSNVGNNQAICNTTVIPGKHALLLLQVCSMQFTDVCMRYETRACAV